MGTNNAPNGIKLSLVETLRGLFGRDRTDSQGGGLARFETTVENLLQSHGSAILGRVHFLNLEELIVRRGEGRRTRLMKAENVILSVIGKNLQEGETYVRPEVGAIWFLFPDLTREASDLKCAAIADQIARALSEDDPIFSDLKSKRIVEPIDRKTWSARKSASPASRAPALRVGSERKGREKETPPSRPDPKTGSSMPTSRQRIARNLQRESSSPAAALYADRLPEGISVGYQAIWNVRSKMITSYAAVPRRRYPDGTTVTGRSILGADTGFAPVAALDSLVQRESVGGLRELMRSGQQTLLVLPIHFSTVDNQSLFVPYWQELAGLTPDERKHVVIEVLHVSDALPAFRAKDIISRLRPLARCVLVQISPDSTRIRSWVEAGAHAVGFAVTEERYSEKVLMDKMNAFVARAEEAGIHAFAHDVTTPSLATAAVAAGFRYVGGPAILPETNSPQTIEPFECERIFSQIVSSRPSIPDS